MKKIIQKVYKFMSVDADQPDLIVAQHQVLSQQIPLLYIILLINSWLLASSYIQVAPLWLAILWPGLLTLVSLVRLVQWRQAYGVTISPAQAAHDLSRTNGVAAVLAVAFSAWAISLYSYGDVAMQSHTAFYMAITVIGCIFCLMHLRPAAFTVAIVVNTIFVTFFLSTGNPVFIAMALNVLLITGTMLTILMVNYRDFTALIGSRRALEAKQAETLKLSDENFRLANLDSLTDLGNRRRFFTHLEQAVAQADGLGDKVTLGILDLDGFKPINDTYGHAVGDALLVELANRLRQACGTMVEPFRLGGDEFALVFSDADKGNVLELAYDICAILREPFVLRGCTARISGTIGLAIYPEMANEAQELFERADYAMYRAKRGSGRGEAWLFTDSDEADIRRSSLVEQALRGADIEAEFSLVFQPIVNVRSNATVGFEALARWESPLLGKVSPSEFIPVAERAGLVNNLTPIFLRKALQTMAEWPRHIRLSFNLSVYDISQPDALQRVMRVIANSRIPPEQIDLEITETAMVRDFSEIMAAVECLKAMGMGISLDDFGTGYSSLTQVHQLPLDKLKIDRSFVTNIDSNPASLKIVKSLISLCTDLGLVCVVEGVETAAEYAVLRQLDCGLVQGYFTGRPMSASAAMARLNTEAQPLAISG